MLQETRQELIRERDFYLARAGQAEERARYAFEAGDSSAESYHLNEARNFDSLARAIKITSEH